MSIKITCIKKGNGDHENPYVAISTLSWINEDNQKTGSISRVGLYDWIKDDKGVAYVRDSNGNIAKLEAKISLAGNKYVRTIPDNTVTDNLLILPECK